MTKKLQIIILVVVSFLMYSNTLKNPFIWDDKGIIEDLSKPEYQKHLKNPFFFLTPSYWKEYTKFHDVDAYVPVSPIRMLSLNIDYKIWKLNPLGYHLTNIFIHIANVILVYLLIVSIFGSQKLAFFSSLIFSVHPMHTESINWIKNRIDMIATFFMMLSFLFFVKFEKEKKNLWLYLVSIISFFFALLSKEISVTLPAVLLFYIFCFVDRREWNRKIILTIPFWLVNGLYFYFTQVILKKGLKLPLVTQLELDLYSNILLVFKTIVYYIKFLLFPFEFNLDRTVEVSRFIVEDYNWLWVVIVIGLIYFAIHFFKKGSNILAFSIFWFFITISPVSNIIYLAPRPIAEQRLYLPSLGFCLLVGWAILNFSNFFNISNSLNLKFGYILLVLVVGVYSIFVIRRNFDWSDEILLWTKTAEKSKGNPRPWFNLGEAYFRKSEIEKAKLYFEKSLKVAPSYPPAHRGLAFVYFKTGEIEKAIRHFQMAGDIE
jgi:tetratricopeptide (TPR) repeat protein